jgi:MutS domain V
MIAHPRASAKRAAGVAWSILRLIVCGRLQSFKLHLPAALPVRRGAESIGQVTVKLFFDLRFTLQQVLSALSPGSLLLRESRAKWAQVGTKDDWLASRYFDLTRRDAPAHHVDDKTWVDLEFPKVFADLDTTSTRIGSQALFRGLRVYAQDANELNERYGVYRALRADPALREEIQLALAHLREDSNAYLADFLFGEPPERPRYLVPVLLWGLFSVAVLATVITADWPIWPWLVIVAINVIVVLRMSRHVHRDAEALKACARMLGVAERLAAIETNAERIPALARMARQAPRRAEARKAIRWFSRHQTNELAASVILWLNFGFLLELLSYIYAANKVAHFRPDLASTYELVGSLDAAVAIASFLERRPDHCEPVVTSGSLIVVEDGYHPLIDRPVKNSIRLDGRSALVTGSNMAGKTTFIKMVGLNMILGQTLGFCLASKAVLPRSAARAAIRGEHSVESGKSHYFAEIEAILSFIESAKQGTCRVFLIDELFSGTNTVERIAAARAVLKSISSDAQVLVTTHDVELQALLGERFDLYHFQEDPDVVGFFDYRLRPGQASERNAIRLLARLGFPDNIVGDALTFVTNGGSAPLT